MVPNRSKVIIEQKSAQAERTSLKHQSIKCRSTRIPTSGEDSAANTIISNVGLCIGQMEVGAGGTYFIA